jgi:hypothetical protein
MKVTRISNHWLLEADGFLTQNEDKAIEERTFFKTIRVNDGSKDAYREATDAEVAEWEEYKRKQEEELGLLNL